MVFTGTNASQITDLLNEVYFDELNHVLGLRSVLGSAAIPRPAINLAAFGAITATNALSIARLLEDIGVTAYASGIAGLTSSNATYAAQILGAESFHSGALRLISIQNPTIAAYIAAADGLDVPPADLGTAALAAAGPNRQRRILPHLRWCGRTRRSGTVSTGTFIGPAPADLTASPTPGPTSRSSRFSTAQAQRCIFHARAGFFPSGVNGTSISSKPWKDALGPELDAGIAFHHDPISSHNSQVY